MAVQQTLEKVYPNTAMKWWELIMKLLSNHFRKYHPIINTKEPKCKQTNNNLRNSVINSQ